MFIQAVTGYCSRALLWLTLTVMAMWGATAYGQTKFIDQVIDFLGISATPGAVKGGDEAAAGDIWIADLATDTRFRLTQDGGYRSPVFAPSGERVLALQNDQLLAIPLDGSEPEKLAALPGVIKLIGFDKHDNNRLLLLQNIEHRPVVAVWSLKDGERTVLPYEPEGPDRVMLNHLYGWQRDYDGVILNTRIDDSNKTNVYLKQGDAPPRNISQCVNTDCGQPSLSSDHKMVAYIKR